MKENENVEISTTPGKDLLMGIGISAVGYGFIFLLFSLGLPMTYVALTTMLIMCALAFLIVKFFRTKRTNAAVIMLVLWAPSVLFLLLMGSCALLFMGL